MCMNCGSALEPGQRKRCLSCRAIRERQGRVKDTPCTGCGSLMWTSANSAPPERRLCHPCRRSRSPNPEAHRKKPVVHKTCPCGAEFATTQHSRQRYCSPQCLGRPGPRKKPRELRKGRYGRPWNRLRAQVIAEEAHCGICGREVDKTLKWPHARSPSVDHVIPLSVGGECLDRNNVRLAHLGCNRTRGDRF